MQNGNARGPFGVYKKGLEETFRLRRGERLGGVGGPVQRNFQREEVVPRPLGVRRALHSGPAGPARSLKPGSGGFGPPVLPGPAWKIIPGGTVRPCLVFFPTSS